MSLKSIWVIGDWREPVFEEAIAWLRTHADCQRFESPAAAAANSSNGCYPQAIVFVQSRSGRFAAEHVENLHAREPLARLLVLTGPWSEGEQRSGKPMAGVTRIAWRNWRERLPIELALDDHAVVSPRTATDTDRIARMVKLASGSRPKRRSVQICTARLSAYDYIAAAVEQLGFSPLLFGPLISSSISPAIVIFDGWEQASAFKKQSITQDRQPHARRILLLHFPRPEDHVLAQQSGIDAVLAHPLSLADLNSALSNAMAPAA
ncbi:MAG TPA: hypothetical protein VGI40_04270 [Pirellulaceae bacterium]|jgi:CheY-like chemotaxis protein